MGVVPSPDSSNMLLKDRSGFELHLQSKMLLWLSFMTLHLNSSLICSFNATFQLVLELPLKIQPAKTQARVWQHLCKLHTYTPYDPASHVFVCTKDTNKAAPKSPGPDSSEQGTTQTSTEQQ